MNYYIGNDLQLRGIEQYILQNGKGHGMKFLYIRNGCGLEVWISLDRAGDISRLNFGGYNMGYFAPCGYVAPQYYDNIGDGFLKSFTAGFFTTCGLTAVGSPCVDDNEQLPLHGTISHIPAELLGAEEEENGLRIHLKVSDCQIFGRKLILKRDYFVSYRDNIITVNDNVINYSDTVCPYMILYHCNMGYPLLDETSYIKIPHNSITPRNRHAEKYIDSALSPEKPQANYQECCYYFDVSEKSGLSNAGIFNAKIEKGVVLKFDKKQLPCFTEWKMMKKNDYVLGLEPGNCTPDGRDVLRKNKTLKFLKPEESSDTRLVFKFISDKKLFEGEF